jgi:hypothetical protein
MPQHYSAHLAAKIARYERLLRATTDPKTRDALILAIADLRATLEDCRQSDVATEAQPLADLPAAIPPGLRPGD